jgi:hypothetical protein
MTGKTSLAVYNSDEGGCGGGMDKHNGMYIPGGVLNSCIFSFVLGMRFGLLLR